MMQDYGTHRDATPTETEALFEISFEGENASSADEEKKQRIYQELMSLEW